MFVFHYQISLNSVGNECSQHQESSRVLQNEIQLLAEKYEQQCLELIEITNKLQVCDEHYIINDM